MNTDNIKFENLMFGTERKNDNKALPSLYFIDSKGNFTRVRPYHEDGFTIVERSNRNVYLISLKSYDELSKIQSKDSKKKFLERVQYLTGKCSNDLYKWGMDVSGKAGLRVADYSDNGSSVHKGHFLVTCDQIEEIYKKKGIDLKAFIKYVAQNPDEFDGIESDKIIVKIQEALKKI